MTVVTIRSEEARIQWLETIDAAYVDRKDVVIERYGKPIVTVVNYIKWQDVMRRLKELELVQRTRQRYEEMKADPSLIVTEEEYQGMLEKEGLAV